MTIGELVVSGDVFDFEDALAAILPNPRESLQRTFRITKVSGIAEDLEALLAGEQFDIVHLVVAREGRMQGRLPGGRAMEQDPATGRPYSRGPRAIQLGQLFLPESADGPRGSEHPCRRSGRDRHGFRDTANCSRLRPRRDGQ